MWREFTVWFGHGFNSPEIAGYSQNPIATIGSYCVSGLLQAPLCGVGKKRFNFCTDGITADRSGGFSGATEHGVVTIMQNKPFYSLFAANVSSCGLFNSVQFFENKVFSPNIPPMGCPACGNSARVFVPAWAGKKVAVLLL